MNRYHPSGRGSWARSLTFWSVAASVLVSAGCVSLPFSSSTAGQAPNLRSTQTLNASDAAKVTELQAEINDTESQLGKANSTISGLQQQLTAVPPGWNITAQATASVVGPPPNWETDASRASGTRLLATYSDWQTAPAAWDVTKHPIVYASSQGHGYAGYTNPNYTAAGVYLMDAQSRTAFAFADFDLTKVASNSALYCSVNGLPHCLGISPDGSQYYIPTSNGTHAFALFAGPAAGRLLVVDAKTLRLRQILGFGNNGTNTGVHHIKAFTSGVTTSWGLVAGQGYVLAELGGNGCVILDPQNNNKVIKWYGPDYFKGLTYQCTVDPTGKYLWGDSRSVIPNEVDASGFVKISLADDSSRAFPGGKSPNGITFSVRGGFTYAIDSANTSVYKIDNTKNVVTAIVDPGAPGPYAGCVNWDSTKLFVTGKGESSFNLGGNLGVVDLKTFSPLQEAIIGGQTIDHVELSPIQANNEVWVSSSGTHETIVASAAPPYSVIARIPTPEAGDTHSGGFVTYNAPNYTGVLEADEGGSWGNELATQITLAASASMP